MTTSRCLAAPPLLPAGLAALCALVLTPPRVAQAEVGSDDIRPTDVTVGLTTTYDICDRTQEVESALLAAVMATNCALVPDDQLAAVTTLDLSAQSISSLQADDFAGLTGLTTLDLADNAQTTLPGGVFDSLTSQTTLDLGENIGLLALPAQCPHRPRHPLDGATFTRPAAAAAPTDLTATFISGNIEISWTAPGTATTSYQILRKAGSEVEAVYVEDNYDLDADAPPTTFTDSGVTEGETYANHVRALNAGGASVMSGAATVLAALVISGPSAVSHPRTPRQDRRLAGQSGPARHRVRPG